AAAVALVGVSIQGVSTCLPWLSLSRKESAAGARRGGPTGSEGSEPTSSQ
ncbi:unnamed protein product, partial [Urochloa humidicola]